MSYRQEIYHAVISTHSRRMTITNDNRTELYKYIWSYLKSRKCYLYRIGGIPNHIHILFDKNPKITVPDLMRDLKMSASKWMKQNRALFPNFDAWGHEYFCISRSYEQVEQLKTYIMNQQEHHRRESFDDELNRMLRDIGLSEIAGIMM